MQVRPEIGPWRPSSLILAVNQPDQAEFCWSAHKTPGFVIARMLPSVVVGSLNTAYCVARRASELESFSVGSALGFELGYLLGVEIGDFGYLSLS